MKSFAHASFQRLFGRLLDASNPGLKLSVWEFEGAQFERHRTSVQHARYRMTCDVFLLSHISRPRWTLLVAKDYWWAGEDVSPIRHQQWARPVSGSRQDIMLWLRRCEQELDRADSEKSEHRS